MKNNTVADHSTPCTRNKEEKIAVPKFTLDTNTSEKRGGSYCLKSTLDSQTASGYYLKSTLDSQIGREGYCLKSTLEASMRKRILLPKIQPGSQ